MAAAETLVQTQRVKQLFKLNANYETAQAHPDGPVTVQTSEGPFSFVLDSHNKQRSIFYNMLRGRLRSAVEEGMGPPGFRLVEGKVLIE